MIYTYIIGRPPDRSSLDPGVVYISLDDPYVSTKHAKLEIDPEERRVWIEDLGSTNGTHVNGVKVYDRTELQFGDLLRIGHTDMPWNRFP